MSQPVRMADDLWNDAAQLVEQFEQACCQIGNDPSPQKHRVLLSEMTSDLLTVTNATEVILWQTSSEQISVLAQAGDRAGIEPGLVATGISDTDVEDRNAIWIDQTTLQIVDAISPKLKLGLTSRFSAPVDESHSEAISEISETLFRLAVNLQTRIELKTLHANRHEATDLDHTFFQRLYAGIGRDESFASIALAVSTEMSADRILLLRRSGNQFRIVTSSTQPQVDRRARQTRVVEKLVTQSSLSSRIREDGLLFCIGDPESSSSEDTVSPFRSELDDYLDDTGVRQMRLEFFADTDAQNAADPKMAMLIERFSASKKLDAEFSRFDSIRTSAAHALASANRLRESHGLFSPSRLLESSGGRRLAWIGALASFTVLALCLLPTEFSVPASGRLMPASQQRLFAPLDAVVESIMVEDGQVVTINTPLIKLRSDSLNRLEEDLRGRLATAETQLSVTSASRIRSQAPAARNDSRSSMDTTASSNEKVLQTEIDGLKAQLSLLREQKASLILSSDRDGRVHRWDLQQAFANRPVAHGEHLLDVVSEAEGWRLEIDVADQDSFYVDAALQSDGPRPVNFRVRSNSDTKHTGELKDFSSVATLDGSGQPVVRTSIRIPNSDEHSFHVGATVSAGVSCGYKPLGFVWFRSVIQWARQTGWL